MAVAATTHSRYRIVETIGRGGMGEVCLADDLMLDRRVALKFLTASPHRGDALERLLSEARAAAALDHPFICKIYEVTELDGRPCIVMEYVRGETLERRLRRGPLPLPQALRLGEEVAEALEAAHKRRLIHRDLKPANVMLTEDRHIKVMDFGLATRLPPADDAAATPQHRSVEAGLLTGTPAYMSPEQLQGHSADHRSDIFAFGIVLYELVSARHPFLRVGVDATLHAILADAPPDLHVAAPGIPGSVAAVVARSLAKNPADRHQSFDELRLELRRLAADLTMPAPGVTPIVPEPPPGDRGATLAGRDAERAELLQGISRAIAGRGGLVVLTGDAGVGKTRLADEALGAARRLGCLALVGRCYEGGGTSPLIPYVEILEESARLIPAPAFSEAMRPSAPELARLLPELHRLFPDMAPPLELPPDLRQRFLFRNIRDFLARCSRETPLAVFLDDLQWADESTLQLTQHLAPHLERMRVFVIAAFRDAEAGPARPVAAGLRQRVQRAVDRFLDIPEAAAAAHAVEQLAAQRMARVVTLGPLPEAAVGMMLAAFGRGEPPPALARKVWEQSGGNPLFTEELCRHLIDHGRLFDRHGRWERDVNLDDLEVPATVRLIIDRRLQRVSSATREVLAAAAVIGRHFELDLLEAVVDAGGDALRTALDEAEQAHVLKGPSGRQERRWRFAHQLICQTLTGQLSSIKRQRMHLRVADAMVRLDPELRTYTSDVAHHLYNAGHAADPARTARALVTAGDAADAVYATEDAIRHYRHALEVLTEARADPAMRPGVEERLADLLALRGDRTGALQHYHAVMAAHERAGDPVAHARVIRKIGTLHWHGGDRTEARAHYQRALDTLDAAPAHIERAHLYQDLGLAAFRSGDNEQAIGWAERALRSAEAALADSGTADADVRRTATAAIAHATNTIGAALARSGHLEAARERIEHSVTAALQQGLLDVACRAYANLGVLYGTLEPKRAIDVSLLGLELASRIGAASLQSYIYANLAAAYCALTERCDTEGLLAARSAVDLDRQLGQLDHLAVPLIVIGQIHQCQGELQQALDAYHEALSLAEKIGEPQLLLPCYDGLATSYLDRGDRARAEEYMEKARDLCQRTGIDPDTLLLLPFLC